MVAGKKEAAKAASLVTNGWPGLEDFVGRLNFLVLGLILVVMMLLRPQGILPSRVREQELKGDDDESARENQTVSDLRAQ